jgi:hypothetical protein
MSTLGQTHSVAQVAGMAQPSSNQFMPAAAQRTMQMNHRQLQNYGSHGSLGRQNNVGSTYALAAQSNRNLAINNATVIVDEGNDVFDMRPRKPLPGNDATLIFDHR